MPNDPVHMSTASHTHSLNGYNHITSSNIASGAINPHHLTTTNNTLSTTYPQGNYFGSNYQYQQPWGYNHYSSQPPSVGTPPTTPQKETEVSHVVGDGKNTTWTFDAHKQYPDVRVYTRSVEKDPETDEKVVSLSPVSDAEVEISDGSVRVTFKEAPSRRGAVVVID